MHIFNVRLFLYDTMAVDLCLLCTAKRLIIKRKTSSPVPLTAIFSLALPLLLLLSFHLLFQLIFPWSLFVAGYSHGTNFNLFSVGSAASAGFGDFAERAETDGLEEELHDEDGVYDSFVSKPIAGGKGLAHSRVFVNGLNPKVSSLVLRITPANVVTKRAATRQSLSHFYSFKIRCKTYPNEIKFADLPMPWL